MSSKVFQKYRGGEGVKPFGQYQHSSRFSPLKASLNYSRRRPNLSRPSRDHLSFGSALGFPEVAPLLCASTAPALNHQTSHIPNADTTPPQILPFTAPTAFECN